MLCVPFIPRHCSTFTITMLYALVIQTLQLQITWDPSENWLHFYQRYCGRFCKNGILENDLRGSCQQPPCFECDCEATCLIYGTCCPTIDLNNQTDLIAVSNRSQEKNILSSDRFVCISFPRTEDHFYVISDCSPGYTSFLDQAESYKRPSISISAIDSQSRENVHARCTESNMDTFDDVTPYLDLRYGITFKNKFCAVCNGYDVEVKNNTHSMNTSSSDIDRQAAAWTLEVVCNHFQNVYPATSELELFKSVLQTGRDQCSIVYKQPNTKIKAKHCIPEMNVVTDTRCSSTDSRLQNYCLSSKQKYLRVQGGQNMFCYMCNGGLLVTEPCTDKSLDRTETPREHVAPTSILLGTMTSKLFVGVSNKPKCNTSMEWLTIKDECEPADCSVGKIIHPDGMCKTSLKQVRGLGYKLFLVLTPTPLNTCVSNAGIRHLGKWINDSISKLSQEVELEVNVTVLLGSQDGKAAEFLQKVTIMAHFISSMEFGRDLLENQVLDLVKGDWGITLSRGNNSPLLLTHTILGTEFAARFDAVRDNAVTHNLTLRNTFNNTMYPLNTFAPENSQKDCPMSTIIFATNMTSTVVKLYRSVFPSPKSKNNQWSFANQFIDVTHSLTCPFVTVNVSDVRYHEDIVTIIFLFKDRYITVMSPSYISLIDGQLRVCVDLFTNLTTVFEMTAQDDLSVVRFYLEFVCVFLSIVCLLISAVTYCLFPTLRTVPGLNNMALSISLAVAHLMLLITAQFGISGHLPPGYCLFHAIALHYSWLASFMWMSACCIHMYRLFTNQHVNAINSSSNIRRHLRFCLYALGSPLVIIVLLIVLCLWITSGASIGYSSKFCFLDIEISIWITVSSLIAPLCFTVLSNGVLFFLTVKEIAYVSSLHKHRSYGQSVKTYAQLSTLTGISYVIGGLALQLQSPVLSLMISPLLCLQGVFIFMSFVFKKRVGKLYSELVGRTHELSQDSSSSKRRLYESTIRQKKQDTSVK